jgi:hypothetical protein
MCIDTGAQPLSAESESGFASHLLCAREGDVAEFEAHEAPPPLQHAPRLRQRLVPVSREDTPRELSTAGRVERSGRISIHLMVQRTNSLPPGVPSHRTASTRLIWKHHQRADLFVICASDPLESP